MQIKVIEETGKAYANRKKEKDRPAGDLYHTPKSLVWTAEDIIKKEFRKKDILDPCCGEAAISEELEKMGHFVILNDLYSGMGDRFNYLKNDIFDDSKYVISNPPFSLWDDFIHKSKSHCRKFMYIGRLNYFGTASRNYSGIWKNLKYVLIFNRYVDYQTPLRDDGLFHVGAMATAWFIWDMKYKGEPKIKILDVNKYATLGNFNKRRKIVK